MKIFSAPSLLLCCLTLAVTMSLEEQFSKLTRAREKRYLTIPYGSAIGIITAFAIPADLPKQDVLFSWNMEANYNLPDELYYFGTAPTVPDLNQDPDLEDPMKRSLHSLTRKNTYEMIQHRLQMLGFNGHACLLRIICELSQSPLDHNGLIGQLLEVLLKENSANMVIDFGKPCLLSSEQREGFARGYELVLWI